MRLHGADMDEALLIRGEEQSTIIVAMAAAPPLASPFPEKLDPPPTATESPTPGPATMETAFAEKAEAVSFPP